MLRGWNIAASGGSWGDRPHVCPGNDSDDNDDDNDNDDDLMMMMMILMMIYVQYLQLTKLRDHLRNPDMSSDEYRYKCRKTFWRMVSP